MDLNQQCSLAFSAYFYSEWHKVIEMKALLLTIKPILLLCCILLHFATCKESFVASFQKGIKGPYQAANNVWIEFSNQTYSTKEFTSCLWFKLKFYNFKSAACLWSYCTVENLGDKMKCLQVCLKGDLESANRNLIIVASIPTKNDEHSQDISMRIPSYIHRTWSHHCWSFSVINEESKFYYNGNLLGIKTFDRKNIELAIKGSVEVHDAALLFGQEPDEIRGHFENNEAFIGDIAELNIWNYEMSDLEIRNMGLCKLWLKGNLISWNKSEIIAHNVPLIELPDPTVFCSNAPHYVIFPQKVLFTEAKEICQIHGGNLVIPKSERENAEIMDILIKHKESCVVKEHGIEGNAVWIGAKKINHKWYELSSLDRTGKLLNYTKFVSTDTTYYDCAYIQNNGFWMGGTDACFVHSFCSICVINTQPVFTLKGVCYNSVVDYNYYISVDASLQIEFYEGYKSTNIVYEKSNQTWRVARKSGSGGWGKTGVYELPSRVSTILNPVGRKRWHVIDPKCKIDDEAHPLAISTCNFPGQFTCDSGHCINVDKRCDERKECADSSDERQCSLVNIPSSYNKANSPENNEDGHPFQIRVHAQIINIDDIDPVYMAVTLTMELHLKWNDYRLTFSNPSSKKRNIIEPQVVDMIWTPLQSLIHENAIVGEITYGAYSNIKLESSVPQIFDMDDAIENRVFNGTVNNLALTQTMKTKYNCLFDVRKFPFDGKHCSFIMKMIQKKEGSLTFVEDQRTFYNGSSIVHQFLIGDVESKIEKTNDFTKYIIIIPMNRIFTGQILNTFIPTFILLCFGYSTIFIDTLYPNDRFIGSGTALLVMVTLLNSVTNELPITSYMKYIDIWFAWHLFSIFSIILFHVTLGRLHKYFQKPTKNQILPYKTLDSIEFMKRNSETKLNDINNIFAILFPTLNCIFYAIYFYFTIN